MAWERSIGQRLPAQREPVARRSDRRHPVRPTHGCWELQKRASLESIFCIETNEVS